MMIDWDDLRVVLAVAREGTLTAAARALGVSQPTVGRRLAAFEAKLGFSPFERTTQGLQLTALGRELTASLESMDEAALSFTRKVAGRAGQSREILTVACLDWVANWILAPAAADFSAQHPTIALEVQVDFRKVSLSRYEADIAIRHSRFEQLDLIQKKLAELPSAIYASPVYLEAHGEPRAADGYAGHRIVTVHRDLSQIADHRWLQEMAFAACPAFRSNNLDAILRATLAGAGLTVLPRIIGDGTGLVRLRSETSIPGRDLWIGYHRDLRRTNRVAAFIRFLGERLERRVVHDFPRRAAPQGR